MFAHHSKNSLYFWMSYLHAHVRFFYICAHQNNERVQPAGLLCSPTGDLTNYISTATITSPLWHQNIR